MRGNEFPIESTGDKSQVCSTLIVVQPISHTSLCYPMDCSTPGSPVFLHLSELAQTHVHWVGDAVQPSLPPSFPSPPAFSRSQHQGLFQWVGSLHQVAKVLEPQFQHQSSRWIVRVVSFRMDWDVLQGVLRSLLQHHNLKASNLHQSISHVRMWELDYKEDWALQHLRRP